MGDLWTWAGRFGRCSVKDLQIFKAWPIQLINLDIFIEILIYSYIIAII